MKPGVKPPHLWGWTPRKWFESVINDRLSLNRDQRDRYELPKTNLIFVSICLSLMFSYGLINPKDMITNILKERSCDTSAQTLEPEPIPVPEKAPPEEPPVCPPKKKKELPKCP